MNHVHFYLLFLGVSINCISNALDNCKVPAMRPQSGTVAVVPASTLGGSGTSAPTPPVRPPRVGTGRSAFSKYAKPKISDAPAKSALSAAGQAATAAAASSALHQSLAEQARTPLLNLSGGTAAQPPAPTAATCWTQPTENNSNATGGPGPTDYGVRLEEGSRHSINSSKKESALACKGLPCAIL